MKDFQFCPLCGAELPISESAIILECQICGAKEYKFLIFPLGYLYFEEYEQFITLVKWIIGIASAILLVGIGIYLSVILPITQ